MDRYQDVTDAIGFGGRRGPGAGHFDIRPLLWMLHSDALEIVVGVCPRPEIEFRGASLASNGFLPKLPLLDRES